MKLFEAGQDPAQRSGHEISSRVSGRPQRHHHPQSDDALFRIAAGSRSGTGLERLRNRHPSRAHRQTSRTSRIRFVYSDINFILMGEIVRRLSGEIALRFRSRERFCSPLGMRDTMFLPPASLRARIAPTELDTATGQPLRGVVHDDTSRFMGGVAGHAGLFTTADDLAKFAQMMLDQGEANGKRLFSPLTIEKFTTPAIARRSADSARSRLGYRFALFQQSRRFVSHRLVRAHRIYRHFHLDRSVQPQLRDPDDEFGASASREIAHFAAQPHRHHRRGVLRNCRAGDRTNRLQRDHYRPRFASNRGAQRATF